MTVRHVLRHTHLAAACIAALAVHAAHATDPNLLPNGTFDASVGGVGWTNVGTGGAGYVSHPDVANSATSGSFEVTNSTGRSSCFRLTPNAAFSFGASYTGENLFGATSDGGMTCYAYAGSDCSGSAQTLAHIDMSDLLEIFAREPCQTFVDLVGMDAAAGADEVREDRGVIAAARADLDHGLALLHSTAAEPVGVRAGHSDIEAARRIQREKRVLVEEGGIVIGRHDIGMPAETDRPRSGPDERLAPDGAKGLLDTGIRGFRRGADQLRIERAIFCRTIFHVASGKQRQR